MSYFDLEIAARTIYGEARNQGPSGMEAVAWVIRNRFNSGKWYSAKTIAGTCLKKAQFSCWNRDDPNFSIIANVAETDPTLNQCILHIKDVLSSDTKTDPTAGATFYHTVDIVPSWASPMIQTVQIGAHIFYKES